MARRWFTQDSNRSWDPSKGYNELFAQQVRYIREWFDLTKNRPGLEYSTGTWRKYVLQRNTVYITVDQFTWMNYRDTNDGITPVFQLNVRMAHQANTRMSILDKIFGKSPEAAGLQVFFSNVVTIEFPSNYPAVPPRFRVEDRRNTSANSASHEHHRFAGGWMCILADSDDWDGRTDTIVSGLNAAFDWIVWHHSVYGW